MGARSLREITKSEEWACLLCNPEPIAQLKAQYYCAYKNKAEIKERADKDREVAKEKAAAKRAKKNDVTAKEKEALVKSPQNFLGNYEHTDGVNIMDTKVLITLQQPDFHG